MPEQMAYDITKTVFEKQADLVAVHKEAANIKLENQSLANSGIPFHAGALKYFSENGIKVVLGPSFAGAEPLYGRRMCWQNRTDPTGGRSAEWRLAPRKMSRPAV
jgi:hypothetical protein